MAESFFATLECELLDRHRFATRAEARRALFEYIEGGYHPHRRHSRLGYPSPSTSRGAANPPIEYQAMNRPRKRGNSKDCLEEDIRQAMGKGFDSRRFIPYLMMHEFEALPFSDCAGFGTAIERPELTPNLQQIRDSFESPEEIDDSPNLAPSKRIEALYPGYQKPLLGILAALEIGLSSIRAECPHFSSWVSHLENLPASG